MSKKYGKIYNSKGMSSGTEIEDYLLTATEGEAAKMEKPFEKRQLQFFWWIIIAALAILGGRVFYLNVIRGSYYQEVAQGNRIRSIAIKAPRGKITDRLGEVLVNNVPSVDLVIVPADLPQDKNKEKKITGDLAGMFNINEEEIIKKIESSNKSSVSPVLVKENISQDELLIFTERSYEFPGVAIEKTAVRDYASGFIFSHILGYVGKIEKKELDEGKEYSLTDYIGKQGIEKSYEKYLKGLNGAIQAEVDSLGNVKKELGTINPIEGDSLILSIDSGLQKKIFDELSLILEKTETKTAAAVAINPKNGEVLALVSLPSFDNNLFTHGISGQDYSALINDQNKPLFNRAISGEYPPGSTIKPLIATAALTEGVITPSTIIDGLGGSINIGNFHFGDWTVHGSSDVRTAIAQSNDIFFYTLGGGYGNIQGLGMDRMKKYENLFGLGNPLGIDIPGESDGLIPSEQWKLENVGEKWYLGDSYHAAIGQGFVTLTPLQLVDYIAAIANGGTLYQPRLVSQIKETDGSTTNIKSKVLQDNTNLASAIKVVQEGMRKTIIDGTARSLNDLPVEVAGKTGTAQFGGENKTHAWFVSYAPYGDPQIVLMVLVEGGGEGSSSSVPVTKDVYQWYFGGRN